MVRVNLTPHQKINKNGTTPQQVANCTVLVPSIIPKSKYNHDSGGTLLSWHCCANCFTKQPGTDSLKDFAAETVAGAQGEELLIIPGHRGG